MRLQNKREMAYCYFNGSVVDEKDASLSIQGIGTLRGFGVFDFFRMRNGKYTFLQDHLDRFEKSQQFLGLKSIISQDEIKEALDTLKEWNKFPDSGFKLVLLGDGEEYDEVLSPLFYVIHSNFENYKAPTYASVILEDYVREYPSIKTTNYFTSNLRHKKRVGAGAIDVLYHKNDLLSEASRSNLFIVKDGRLLTPEKNILAGITRKNVLKIAPDIIETHIGDVSLSDLKSADEVMLSSSLKEVCPIVEIDGKPVGNGKVGPISRKLNQRFQELISD